MSARSPSKRNFDRLSRKVICGWPGPGLPIGARGAGRICRGLLAVAVWLVSVACSASSDATKNHTFYDWSLGDGSQVFERPFPSLNWPKEGADPDFLGVTVLEGAVSFSRPNDWLLRNASNRPDEPYVHYVTPDAYSFAIYQRRDPPEDSWEEILGRYEADLQEEEATNVGGRIPMAVLRGQGRAYSIRRDVEAKTHPLLSRSREMLIRGKQAVVLVQIVHQDHDLSAVDDELLRAVATVLVR